MPWQLVRLKVSFPNTSMPWQLVRLKVAEPKICMPWQLVRLKVAFPPTDMPWQLIRLKVAETPICMPWQLVRLKVSFPRWSCRWLCGTKNERKPSKKRVVSSCYPGFNETRSERRNPFHFHRLHFPISITRGWFFLFLSCNKDRFCLTA